MNLKVGILIIGSLYWDRGREIWRKSRLDETGRVSIKVPIRYGRFSKVDRKHYTMVFSLSAEPGSALVLPCKKPVTDLTSLVEEAHSLWAAERNKESDSISADWGSVAILPREPSHAILNEWANYLEGIDYTFKFPHSANEDNIVSESGLLRLPWPHTSDGKELDGFDLLLATANEPTTRKQEYPIGQHVYPTAEQIAAEFNQRNWIYFDSNVENGIWTFEDEQIQQLRAIP